MNAAYSLQKALEGRSDERGYVRTTLEELVGLTNLSPRTIQRTLTQLVEAGLILRRSKPGPAGGILIRLESPPKSPPNPRHNPVKSDGVHHVVNQTPSPEGALGGLVRETDSGQSPPPSTSTRGPAWREAAPHQVPESGAELVYTGPSGDGHWIQLSPTAWLDPRGFTVSTKSMTPELKMRLGVDH